VIDVCCWAMFVNNAKVGYMVYYYVVEDNYYEFAIEWEKYESYFGLYVP